MKEHINKQQFKNDFWDFLIQFYKENIYIICLMIAIFPFRTWGIILGFSLVYRSVNYLRKIKHISSNYIEVTNDFIFIKNHNDFINLEKDKFFNTFHGIQLKNSTIILEQYDNIGNLIEDKDTELEINLYGYQNKLEIYEKIKEKLITIRST